MANLAGNKINQIVAAAAATFWCGVCSCGVGTQDFAWSVYFGAKITHNVAGVDASIGDFAGDLVKSSCWRKSNPGMT